MGRWVETPPKLTGNASQQSALPRRPGRLTNIRQLTINSCISKQRTEIEIRIPGCMHLSAVRMETLGCLSTSGTCHPRSACFQGLLSLSVYCNLDRFVATIIQWSRMMKGVERKQNDVTNNEPSWEKYLLVQLGEFLR